MKANDIQHGGDHYKKGGDHLQHWDICARYNVNYLESCSTKYVSRWRDKAGMLDLEKAGHYLDKTIELIAEFGYRPGGIVPLHVCEEFAKVNRLSPDEAAFCQLLFRWETHHQLLDAHMYLQRIKHTCQLEEQAREAQPRV